MDNFHVTFFSSVSLAKVSYTTCFDGFCISGNVTSSVEQIDSMTAAYPDAVISKITQHNASGNGVNWPWLIGSTKQSSTSPKIKNI